MKFTDLNLSAEMLETLIKVGYVTPSQIQWEAIPLVLAKKDIIGQAQTGTGKTAAFGVPIIEMTEENRELQHVVLAPSRELATQITEELKKLAVHKNIRIVNIIGGISYTIQERELRNKPNIIVATPGRYIDNYNKGLIKHESVKTLTLDEADEMLNFGFFKDIMGIYKNLPANVQTLFLTATFNKKTKELAQSITKNPVEVKVSQGLKTSERIEQKYLVTKEGEKLNLLVNILQMLNPEAAIIFGKTRRRVEELEAALKKLGFKAVGIQGDMRQRERSNAMASFRDGSINILIGTDVMARGIDVDNVDYVFNFDLPTEIEYYTHRIGRTGRAGRTGTAISFVKDNEMNYFNEIMRATTSKPILMPAPGRQEIESSKEKEVEDSIKDLLIGKNAAHERLGEKLASTYSHEELSIIVAKLLLAEAVNTSSINLTPEAGQSSKSGGRSRHGGGGYGGKSSGGGSKFGGKREYKPSNGYAGGDKPKRDFKSDRPKRDFKAPYSK